MKIGIGLPNQVRDVRAEILPAWAKRSEEAGFSSLGTIGRVAYPGVMDTVALAAAAGATSTIGLVTSVLLAPVWPATLLAKELAGIQGVSGGRLTAGIGLGGRPDDFVVEGAGAKGVGKRMNEALEVYRDLWAGAPVTGSESTGVPGGSIEVPMLFGGMAPAALERMAKWGQGYIAGSVPASMAAGFFEGARKAWTDFGREGEPRLVAIQYYALGDIEKGRAKAHDYYIISGEQIADMIAGNVHGTAEHLKQTVKEFEDLGLDELIFHPMTDDIEDIDRLADVLL